jgi:hypothetical protein
MYLVKWRDGGYKNVEGPNKRRTKNRRDDRTQDVSAGVGRNVRHKPKGQKIGMKNEGNKNNK